MAGTRMPRVERRAQILRAAAAAFRAAGFDGTSMDDVAREAGVTRLIVYRIFESKLELYLAVLGEVTDDIVASFSSFNAPDDHGASALLMGVGRRHPDGFRLLWRHAANEAEFQQISDDFRSVVYDFAEQMIGSVIRDPAMRHWAARHLVGNLYEGVCLWLDEGSEADDAAATAMLAAGTQATVAAWAVQSR